MKQVSLNQVYNLAILDKNMSHCLFGFCFDLFAFHRDNYSLLAYIQSNLLSSGLKIKQRKFSVLLHLLFRTCISNWLLWEPSFLAWLQFLRFVIWCILTLLWQLLGRYFLIQRTYMFLIWSPIFHLLQCSCCYPSF